MITTSLAPQAWRAVFTVVSCLLVFEPVIAAPPGEQQKGAQAVTAPSEEDYTLPPIVVVDVNGVVARLNKERGKVVVMNFWATWCPPCVVEMPEFVKLHRAYQDEKVVLISVSADHPETVETRVKPFVRAQKLPFLVYVAGGVPPDQLGKALNVEWDGALPATFVFDWEGELRKQWFEEVTLDDLQAAVDPLCKEVTPVEDSPAGTAAEQTDPAENA